MSREQLHRRMIALTVSGLIGAGACGGVKSSGAGGAATTGGAPGSGGAGGCGAPTEVFGACSDGKADGGSGAPGAACQTDSDCEAACCPCPHGQTLYAYAACSCGRCASVCDPSNDYRAPVCQDGGGPVVVGCLTCGQILNEALADGEQLGALACPGKATSLWTALGDCVTASCGSVCPGVMPTNACVGCFQQPDAMGGCETEEMACVDG